MTGPFVSSFIRAKALRERILAVCRADPELKASAVAERFSVSNNMARVYVLAARRELEREARIDLRADETALDTQRTP